MARFTATTTFLDDRDRFEEGVEYDADPARVAYFVRSGWATSDDVADVIGVAPQDVTLDIEDGKQPTTSDTPGV